jgi:hypothetical protein
MSSLAPACTHEPMIITFHNHMRQIFQSYIFHCHVSVQLTNYITFHNFVNDNPLMAIKMDSYCGIINTSAETSARKVCDLSKFCLLTNLCYCSLLYIIEGHYSPVVRALV